MLKEKQQEVFEGNLLKIQELGYWRRKRGGESKAKIPSPIQNIQAENGVAGFKLEDRCNKL